MLFVWLMSLGIGVANACLVQPGPAWHEHFSHSHSGMTSGALAEHDRILDKLGKVHVQADENGQSPESAACVNFCVAEQNTLVKHQADGLVAQEMVPLPFLIRLLVPAADQISALEAFASPSGSEPPVSIRYLRLTI